MCGRVGERKTGRKQNSNYLISKIGVAIKYSSKIILIYVYKQSKPNGSNNEMLFQSRVPVEINGSLV